jgi:hypothetical protein
MTRDEAEDLLQQICELERNLTILAQTEESAKAFETQFHLSVHKALWLAKEAKREIKPPIRQIGNFIFTGPHQPDQN